MILLFYLNYKQNVKGKNMAGVVDFGDFESKICASCGYHWDYNVFDKSKLSCEFDRMFFTDIDYCPNCYYLGADIDKLNEKVKSEIDSGKYKKLLAPFNKKFAIVTRQDAFQFVVYAMICEDEGIYKTAAYNFYKAALIEQDTISKYMSSGLYSDRDKKDIELYKRKVEEYLDLSESNIRKYLKTNNDISAQIFLCGLLKKRGKEAEFTNIFRDLIANNKFTKEQVVVLRELKGE